MAKLFFYMKKFTFATNKRDGALYPTTIRLRFAGNVWRYHAGVLSVHSIAVRPRTHDAGATHRPWNRKRHTQRTGVRTAHRNTIFRVSQRPVAHCVVQN